MEAAFGAFSLSCLAMSCALAGASPGPVGPAPFAPIPPPIDRAYPGEIHVAADVSDVQRLTDIAAAWHKEPMDALFDFLIADHAYAYCAVFGMSEPDVSLALQQPWVSINNDSEGASPEGLLGREHLHPRAFGTFPRILRMYVREEHKLTLEDAIRKFSALPAQRMRLGDRGVLREHMWADVVVFDPATVRDLATYDNPNQLSQGMAYVLVNGKLVIDAGAMTGQLPGKVLRGPGYLP